MRAYFRDGPRAGESMEIAEPACPTIYVALPPDEHLSLRKTLKQGTYRFQGFNALDMAVYAYEGPE